MNHQTLKSWVDDTGKFGQDSEKYKYDEIMQDFRARGHSMTKSEFQRFYLDPFRRKFPYSEYLIELMTLTGFKEDPVATNEDRRGALSDTEDRKSIANLTDALVLIANLTDATIKRLLIP
jgi:hypothetical protein